MSRSAAFAAIVPNVAIWLTASRPYLAYSLNITGLDPLQYKLLFERFLNPERVSMPDFDIDFCQANRERVIDYVKAKYGREDRKSVV